MKFLICDHCKGAVHITGKAKQCDCGTCIVAYTAPDSQPFATGPGTIIELDDKVLNGVKDDVFLVTVVKESTKQKKDKFVEDIKSKYPKANMIPPGFSESFICDI